MKLSQLINVMKFHLKNFGKNKGITEITENTVHSEVLSNQDGKGIANSKSIYKSFIQWTQKNAGDKIKKWPGDWMDMSVKDLADKIIIFLMFMLPLVGNSQLVVNIGAQQTDAKNSALTLAVTYIKSFDSVWQKHDYVYAGKHSVFSVMPEARIETGTSDAFSSIILKAQGLFINFKTTTVDDVVTPASDKTFNVFPISVGAETNNQFSNINGLLEAGWVPWYQNATSGIIANTKVGFYVQGGYKFKTRDSVGVIGGQIDESEEMPNSGILRLKGSFSINSPTIGNVNGLKFGLVGGTDLWYDALNSVFYHRIATTARFFIADDRYVDFIYAKGSGAPNFNEGDQFGIGLTLKF